MGEWLRTDSGSGPGTLAATKRGEYPRIVSGHLALRAFLAQAGERNGHLAVQNPPARSNSGCVKTPQESGVRPGFPPSVGHGSRGSSARSRASRAAALGHALMLAHNYTLHAHPTPARTGPTRLPRRRTGRREKHGSFRCVTKALRKGRRQWVRHKGPVTGRRPDNTPGRPVKELSFHQILLYHDAVVSTNANTENHIAIS